jgi:hypothetical protein
MDIDVKINSTSFRDIIPTCEHAGIWRFLVYSAQNVLLPFMKKNDRILKDPAIIEELVIDNVYYQMKNSLAELIPYTYYQQDNICYFANSDYYPGWLYDATFSAMVGKGFTTGKNYIRDHVLYRSGLNFWPQIKEEADNIEAAKMKFNSANLTIKNDEGEFDPDKASQFFGNGVQVYKRDGESAQPLYEYYVKNIKSKLNQATFVLGDKRERLSQKIPDKKFTLEEYPFMRNEGNPEQKSNKLGAVIPDAYGYCVNIPAICVDQFQIYTDPSKSIVKTYRTFKVARKITRLDKVLVKMTQPDASAGSKEVWTNQRGNTQNIDSSNGTFTLNTLYCMPPFDGYDVPEIYEVVCTGIFCPEQAPADIIGELVSHYADLSYDNYNFNMAEFTAELSPVYLANIGLYLDREIDLFAAIEQIQNGSTYAFQFKTDFDKFTARRNDDNRAVSRTIRAVDIANIKSIEFDMNLQEYATIVDIAYAENHMDDTERDDNFEHLQDLSNRDKIFDAYHIDKQYEAQTKLPGLASAQKKAEILIGYFSKLRPLVKGVQLTGREWFNLRVYDIVMIDLRLERKPEPLPGRRLSIVNRAGSITGMGFEKTGRREIVGIDFGRGEPEYREFGGLIKCKITGIVKDTKTETVTVDLVYAG